MNDGMMQPFSESGCQADQQGMERLKKRVEDAGAQFIAITPPPYMADTPEKDAARYNQVLDTCLLYTSICRPSAVRTASS